MAGIRSIAVGAAGGELAPGGPAPFRPAGQVAGQQQPQQAPEQSSWVPDWLRNALRGKDEQGQGSNAADKLGGKAAGGGLTGFVVGKVAGGVIGPVLSGFQHTPLVPYLAGGYGVYRLFLRGNPKLLTGGVGAAPFLLRNPILQGVGRFFVSPPALILTGIATLLRKYVVPRTPGENLLFPILFGPTAFAGDELPSVDEIGKAISRLFAGSFFDLRHRPWRLGPLAEGGADLIPQWQADP